MWEEARGQTAAPVRGNLNLIDVLPLTNKDVTWGMLVTNSVMRIMAIEYVIVGQT